MKKVCLIHTGGTSTMIKNAAGFLEPAPDGDHIIDYVPAIKQLAEINNIFLYRLDSSDIQPEHWYKIAQTISEHYNTYDGFVILHGTDTMAFTATALSFMLGNLSKPVILTGIQHPLTEATPDTYNNLLNAVRAACTPLSEVAILFGHVLLRGNRSKKINEMTTNAFLSPNCLPLAEVGTELRFSTDHIERHNRPLDLRPNLVTDVAYIKIFPGITNEHILGMIPARTKGIVIEAYGAGNIPLGNNGIQEALENIMSHDIATVIATQCVYSRVEYHRYQGGYFAKTHGALSAQDMTSEAALIKLMWLLAQTNNFDDLKKLYHQNLVGELTEQP